MGGGPPNPISEHPSLPGEMAGVEEGQGNGDKGIGTREEEDEEARPFDRLTAGRMVEAKQPKPGSASSPHPPLHSLVPIPL